jgi:hypothetical protein
VTIARIVWAAVWPWRKLRRGLNYTEPMHFHPSLWAPGDYDLLVSQRDHGVDACGTVRGDVARNERDER